MKFKELFEDKEDDYAKWLEKSNELNRIVDIYSVEVNSFVTKGSGGLIPEEVRLSPAFRKADQNFKTAFKILQDFNKKSPKEYKTRSAKEYRASRMAKV